MPLTQKKAAQLQEMLHDFNPNMNVFVKPGNNEVVATINKLQLNGQQLKTLGEIVGTRQSTLDRTGGKLRMIIH